MRRWVYLIIGAFVFTTQAAQMPLTVGEIGLMLRSGYPSNAVMQELSTRHFADTGAAVAVLEHQQVAREERAVRAAQVEQHAVAARDRDDAHAGDARGVDESHGEAFRGKG